MQITDLSKDVIKSGGEWIGSIDLENIAKWWTPDDVVFVDQTPLGATSKMLKTACASSFSVIGCRRHDG